jgi:hypothetical protein
LNFGIIVFAPHETLNGKNGIFRIGHSLPFRYLTDQAFTTFGDRYDGGSEP